MNGTFELNISINLLVIPRNSMACPTLIYHLKEAKLVISKKNNEIEYSLESQLNSLNLLSLACQEEVLKGCKLIEMN